jgi:hypothetical protein
MMKADVDSTVTVVCRCGGRYAVGDGVELTDGFQQEEWTGAVEETSAAAQN